MWELGGKQSGWGERRRDVEKSMVSPINCLPCYLALGSWRRMGIQAEAEEADFKEDYETWGH